MSDKDLETATLLTALKLLKIYGDTIQNLQDLNIQLTKELEKSHMNQDRIENQLRSLETLLSSKGVI